MNTIDPSYWTDPKYYDKQLAVVTSRRRLREILLAINADRTLSEETKSRLRDIGHAKVQELERRMALLRGPGR